MAWLSRWLGWKADAFAQPVLARATTTPADWASRPPYLALLQRFLSMRDAGTGVPDHWELMLGTHPQNVVDGLLQAKVLEPASLAETIEFCYSGVELKKLLKERGLMISGRKAEQSQRLLDADPEGMRRLAAEHQIVRCTPATRAIVKAWLDRQAQALETVVDELIAALRNRQFKAAIQITDAWRGQRFEPPAHPAQEAMTVRAESRALEDRIRESQRCSPCGLTS